MIAASFGEDADDVGATFDLAIEALDRVVTVQLRAVLGWEGHIGEHVVLSAAIKAASLGTVGLSWSATLRHCALAAA
jgi:hypothetical protein